MQWAWLRTRARELWQARFPVCQQSPCSRRGKLWGKAAAHSLWLHQARYCSAQCFEAALRSHLSALGPSSLSPPAIHHRIPLGLLLLARGQLTESQLRAALQAQSGRGGRLGYWLENLGFATEVQITAALARQWACPVLPAIENAPGYEGMVPFHLQKKFRMLPVQFVAGRNVLHIAFSEAIEYAALFAIQEILDCRTEPCLIGSREMQRSLERAARQTHAGEKLFEGWHDPADMARIAAGYVMQTGSRRARVAACGDCVWVFLESASGKTHLLFRRPCPSAAEDAAGRAACPILPRPPATY